ncbi:MAG: YccF domain-containing protein [Candidatus Hydrogenedentes bacterium]|nr:YccF domain-containing protein [Candidatus Hydrogenedentota bacterium]
MPLVNLVMNIIWFIFGGCIAALGWLLAALIMFVTVVGIPFGFGALRIAGFVAWPFGRMAVDADLAGEERFAGTGCANIIWILLAGIWLAISHILIGASLCLTIIGIPWGWQHFKIAELCFAPLGRRIVARP